MSTGLSARLAAARAGDGVAFSQAFEAAYDELRRLARRQLRSLRPGETLATTALVNEAFLKLVRRPVGWEDKTHFFAGQCAVDGNHLLGDRLDGYRGVIERGAAPVAAALLGAALPGVIHENLTHRTSSQREEVCFV